MGTFYTLTHHSFTGISIPLVEKTDQETDLRPVRAVAAVILRKRRRTGHRCSILEAGRKWEILEPDGCMMVPDTAGTLVLEEVDEFAHLPACRVCGGQDWLENGRGEVYCGCQCCPECGEEPGWHAVGCSEAEEEQQ